MSRSRDPGGLASTAKAGWSAAQRRTGTSTGGRAPSAKRRQVSFAVDPASRSSPQPSTLRPSTTYPRQADYHQSPLDHTSHATDPTDDTREGTQAVDTKSNEGTARDGAHPTAGATARPGAAESALPAGQSAVQGPHYEDGLPVYRPQPLHAIALPAHPPFAWSQAMAGELPATDATVQHEGTEAPNMGARHQDDARKSQSITAPSPQGRSDGPAANFQERGQCTDAEAPVKDTGKQACFVPA